MIDEAIVQLLTADANVSAIIGDRAYSPKAPDGATFPLVVVGKAYGAESYTNDGPAGIENGRIQVDCYSADGQSSAIDLTLAVIRKLSGFKGPASPLCCIDSLFKINDFDNSEPVTERAGPRLRRRTIEFSFWASETCHDPSSGGP